MSLAFERDDSTDLTGPCIRKSHETMTLRLFDFPLTATHGVVARKLDSRTARIDVTAAAINVHTMVHFATPYAGTAEATLVMEQQVTPASHFSFSTLEQLLLNISRIYNAAANTFRAEYFRPETCWDPRMRAHFNRNAP